MSREPTRADLLTKLAETEAARDRAHKDAVAWRAVAPSDPEAKAIARCVKALDELPKEVNGHLSRSYGVDHAAVARVLAYLAGRYGAKA